MVDETKKILRDNSIRATATTVRVPVTGGHSESLNIEFEKPYDLEEVKALYAEGKAPSCVLCDDPANNVYPMPIDAFGTNDVLVGRLRRDFSAENSMNMWIAADNLRVGAATNAVRIALSLL